MKTRTQQINALAKLLKEIAGKTENPERVIADHFETASRLAYPKVQFTVLITSVGWNQLSLSHQ